MVVLKILETSFRMLSAELFNIIHAFSLFDITVTRSLQNTNLSQALITCLISSWMRLCFLTDPRGKVPVKVVARTFASGKTEKLVYQCLSELGLPAGKNEAMEKEAFTFDKFYALYHKICPRNDIEELFRSM